MNRRQFLHTASASAAALAASSCTTTSRDEIEATIHAHPTLSEMVKEATEVAKGHPIHV